MPRSLRTSSHRGLFFGFLGACVGHLEANACLTSREGARCAWANDKICMTPDTAQQRLDNKNIETVSAPLCAKRGELCLSLDSV